MDSAFKNSYFSKVDPFTFLYVRIVFYLAFNISYSNCEKNYLQLKEVELESLKLLKIMIFFMF